MIKVLILLSQSVFVQDCEKLKHQEKVYVKKDRNRIQVTQIQSHPFQTGFSRFDILPNCQITKLFIRPLYQVFPDFDILDIT